MSNEVTTVSPRRELATVHDPIPVLDSARFDQMQRIATAMARGSLVPKALSHIKVKGKDEEEPLPYETVLANCFMVVNQAVRWQLDPFSVAQCVSVVHGRLCYEGKLIAGVIDSKLGIKLTYEWNDQPGDAFGIKVSGQFPDGRIESITGTVGDWRTTGNNSPWGKVGNHRRMLAYRGAREWARLYAPAILLGVYSDDELLDLAEDARARRAAPVGLAARLSGPSRSGFSAAHVEHEIVAASGAVVRDPVARVSGAEVTPTAQDAQMEVAHEVGTDTVHNWAKNSIDDVSEPAEAESGQAGGLPATDIPTGAQPDGKIVESTVGSSGETPQASDDASRSRDAGATQATTASPSPHPSEDKEGAPKPSANPDSTKSGQEGAAGSAPDPAPSETDWGKYHRLLARASQSKSLGTYDSNFTEQAENAWILHPSNLETRRQIYRIHLDRVNKKIEPNELLKQLRKLGVA